MITYLLTYLPLKTWENAVFGYGSAHVVLEPPTRWPRSKSALKCIPYNRCVQNFIQIGLDLAVRGPKTRFGVKTENSLVVKISKMVWISTVFLYHDAAHNCHQVSARYTCCCIQMDKGFIKLFLHQVAHHSRFLNPSAVTLFQWNLPYLEH